MRDLAPGDEALIGRVAEAAGLFDAGLAAEMMAMEGVWLVDEAGGFVFARPEEVTDRTWNVLALGVDPAAQGQGLGRRLLEAIEARLTDARLLIVETTQLPAQSAARALYESAGYARVAQIPDFFGAGEDKVVYTKRGAAA